jgi:cytochrome c-type biogenesis protein CcsB
MKGFLKQLTGILFSMKAMTLCLVIFLVAIGLATFIESTHGIQAAKILIYNATWFEALLLLLSLNLISNIKRYQMFKREKIAILSFHLSFLIILLGSAFTRFMSFEGIMVIAEGKSANFIYTSDPHVLMKISNPKNGDVKVRGFKSLLSEYTHSLGNDFQENIDFADRDISIEYVDFKSKCIDSFRYDKGFNTKVLDVVTEGMESHYIGVDESIMVGGIPLIYGNEIEGSSILIKDSENGLMISASVPMRSLAMVEMRKSRETGTAPPDSLYLNYEINKWEALKTTTLYQVGNSQFVIKNIFFNSKKELLHSGSKNRGADYLTVRIDDGNRAVGTEEIVLKGGLGTIPVPNTFSFNGLNYQLEYGSIRKPIPYELICNDFQLDKYPGSESPSSFASEITLNDVKNNKKFNKRIFMNHVLDYEGYRFFQSSYTLDNPKTPENEEGTVLSVNYDYLGTNITYLGYLLMAIGMILSIIAPTGRFKAMNGKLKKIKSKKVRPLLLLFTILSISGNPFFAQHDHTDHNEHSGHNHDKEEKSIGESFKALSIAGAKEFSSVLAQSFEGRIIPAHTLCDQLLRKVHRSKSLKHKNKEYNAVQAVISMHMYPTYWMKQKTIYAATALQKRLGIEKHVAYNDALDSIGVFKWEKEYAKSFQKLESKRDEFDKRLIKFHDRFQVVYKIFSWEYMKLIPIRNDKNNTWTSPLNMTVRRSQDSAIVIASLGYFQAIFEDNEARSKEFLSEIKEIQRTVGAAVVPDQNIVDLEITYNDLDVFKRSYQGYGIVGLLMLILFFIKIFLSKSPTIFEVIRKLFFGTLVAIFLFHASGLAMRWIISGHAPWSNGYEAVVFIAWVSMLAGFLFSKKNAVVIAGTAILASLMIFVTEMNLLDPEITPLQPVLKSYWLMIHVAVITGSYGFLGLACILGLLNLLLYLTQTKNNKEIIKRNINELTYVSEMTMTIGLFMLTIGTFLGGIWANESWGRYWGWDPKETWALVSVLVYAVILHLRFIPGLKSKFTFNLVAFWGYSAILFTFFGVNFVLVGLHSYAQGDGLSDIPNWIWYTVLFFIILSVLSYLRDKSMKRLKSS